MTDPRSAQPLAIKNALEHVRIGMRHETEWIGADQRVDVDHRERVLGPALRAGRFSARRFAAVGGVKPKTRAALRQRMS